MAPPTIELIMVRQSEQMPWCGEYLANIRRSVILPVFQNYQALIICWNPNSYLTGVVSSKLLWYIFNMNIIKMEKKGNFGNPLYNREIRWWNLSYHHASTGTGQIMSLWGLSPNQFAGNFVETGHWSARLELIILEATCLANMCGRKPYLYQRKEKENISLHQVFPCFSLHYIGNNSFGCLHNI